MLLSFLYKDFPVRDPLQDASLQTYRINAIHILHLLSIMFIYTGWLLPPPIPLGIYVLYVGITLLSWRFNADLCPMTETEYRWRHWNPTESHGFTQMFLIRPLFRREVASQDSAAQETWLTNAVVQSIYVFFFIAVIRLVFYIFTKYDLKNAFCATR